MQLSAEMKSYIREHAAADTDKLLLSAGRQPDIDVPFAVDQILARRQIREKLPAWYANEDVLFPSRLAAEQCSSEPTARYKQRLLHGNRLCDLTGGLGVDSFYFAEKAREVIYIERFPAYCEAARTNFAALGAHNIDVRNTDAREALATLETDTFYIDPARRAEGNRRVFALADCEPDILQLKPLLLERAKRVIIKISPMADLEETRRLLPETREIHVVATKNECKELLFVLEQPEGTPGEPLIHAVNLQPDTETVPFVFTPSEEREASPLLASAPGEYLYEPHAALLKSGAFKLTARRYGTAKLHRHSHLYTSDTHCPHFPGRTFRIERVLPFSGKLLRTLAADYPKANIATRNFPLTVAELRKRTGIKEGGDTYLFATTTGDEKKILIATHKI